MRWVRILMLCLIALGAQAAPVLAADEAHADEGHAKPGLMDLHWQESLFTIIVFGIFFLVLSFVVWPKILAALQAREDKQRADLVEAEKAAKEATATLAEYKAQLADAQKQAQQVIEQSKTDAARVGQQLKDQTQAEITQMRQRAEAEIASAKERAIGEIYEQTADLATQVAGRILKREISPADQQALVQESLQELGKLN